MIIEYQCCCNYFQRNDLYIRWLVHGCSEQKSATKKQSAGTPAKAGGRRGQKKDDEWEEVSRKYVCLQSFSNVSTFVRFSVFLFAELAW